ncbi:MAG: hypothetical protein ABJF10_23300 [Chthoniobacter sp.]|uniref:hypothetical protein n=1 Tax=Chthoniobacter sp. TaxID=2510640 RepID=UPI0032ABE362
MQLSDAEYLVYGEAQDTVRFREEYLQTALEISDRGDDAILLLNPKTKTPEGEWEAWMFANWFPGARRYRSFRELMEDVRIGFRDLMERERRKQADPQPKATGKKGPAKAWWKIW